MQQKEQDIRQPYLYIIVEKCENKSLSFVDVNGPRNEIATNILFNCSQQSASLIAYENKEFKISSFMNSDLVFMVGIMQNRVGKENGRGEKQIKKIFIYPPYNFLSRTARDLSWKTVIQDSYVKINSKEMVKRQNMEGHLLIKGQIIKFGKEMYIVSHIHHPLQKKMPIQKLLLSYQQQEVYTQTQLFQGVCRICHSQQAKGRSKILISPCKCKGSCQFIHFACLRKWFQTKTICRDSLNIKSFNLSKLKCEICMYQLPKLYMLMNKLYFLFNEAQQTDLQNSYIILKKLPRGILQGKQRQGIGSLAKQNDQNMMHIIRLSPKNSVKIGRKSDNDIVLLDLTVSRHHAEINLSEAGFELFDLNSRYGTLVSFKQKLQINQKLEIQVGHNVFLLKKE